MRLTSDDHTLQSVIMTLTPTLWRTCRVLANSKRLSLLYYVMATPFVSVSQVASALQLPLPVASQYMRALNARGLLKVKRQGRFVLYEAAADPSMPETSILLKALESTMRTADPLQMAVEALTGFTHPRRIELLRALDGDGTDIPSLGKKTGISTPALVRHLRKLRRRGYIKSCRGKYACARPNAVLARALLALALQ